MLPGRTPSRPKLPKENRKLPRQRLFLCRDPFVAQTGKIFFGILDTISYQFGSCRWLAGLYRIKWRFTAGNDTNPYQPLLLVGFPDSVKIAGGYG